MEGIKELGINGQLLIAQIINFLLLLGLLYMFAYKPILKMFDERANRIKESMDMTESVKQQAANAEEEARKLAEAEEAAAKATAQAAARRRAAASSTKTQKKTTAKTSTGRTIRADF